MRFINYAVSDKTPTPLEQLNEKVSLKCALESIVLLKNDNNCLPLNDLTIDLFGNGARHTIKGGLGSGEVNELNFTSIYDALIRNGFTVNTESWLDRYDILYNQEIKKYKKIIHKSIYHLDFINFMGERINFIPGDLVTKHDIESDTCIYVISRFSGEGRDISKEEYTITDVEYQNLKLCSNYYNKLILVLNVGGFFDLSFLDEINIDSVIYMGNLGRMASTALAQILTRISPSGKMPFTLTNKYEDIPYSNEFSYNSQSLDSNYKEGIYVGYRYYDTFKKEIRYPFGHGLTYSKFEYNNFKYETNNSLIKISFDVKNIGNFKAKETVLLFLEQPKSMGEEKSLVGFNKTLELDLKQKQRLEISFDLFDFSYTENNQKILKKGIYIIRYGNDVLNTKPIFKFKLEDDFILYEIKDNLNGIQNELKKEINPLDLDIEEIKLDLNYKKEWHYLNNNFDILENYNLRDRINLCVGSGILPKSNFISVSGSAGYTTPYIKKLPALSMCDGPSGIRISPKVKVKINGKTKSITPAMNVYNYIPGIIKLFRYARNSKKEKKNICYQKATSFPSGISLAATFNLDLIKEVGVAISKELNALGISYFLAPAINIIKNPIGGRSFEYFSEDPYLSGIIAASFITGIQDIKGQYAVLKHFACNNLEYKRNEISANLSNEALRDIYLKPFEIAIKYANVQAIMSSYNKINHQYVCNNSILLNNILRQEFGFNGLIMTDWLSTGRKYADNILAIKSGNDLIMPGSRKVFNQLLKAYKKNKITAEEVNRAATNVLKSIHKTTIYKKYKN